MEALMEFAIIMGISLAGELLHEFLPLPVPASIYGMLLMLLLLMSGILKAEKVERAGGFLLKIMPVMFIPAAVGLMTIVAEMKWRLIPIAFIAAVTTVIVMAATGRAAQWIIGREEREKHA